MYWQQRYALDRIDLIDNARLLGYVVRNRIDQCLLPDTALITRDSYGYVIGYSLLSSEVSKYVWQFVTVEEDRRGVMCKATLHSPQFKKLSEVKHALQKHFGIDREVESRKTLMEYE